MRKVLQLSFIFVLVFSLLVPLSPLVNKVSAAVEVVKEYKFDDGTAQGWGPRGDVTVESVKDTARSGTNSLKTMGRTANWNGPSLNALDILEKGATYQITGYAKLVNGKSASNLKFTVQRQPEGADTAYDQVNTPVSVTDADWVKLEGEYTYEGAATELQLYAESDDPESEFYLDDITIILTVEAPPEAPVEDVQMDIPSIYEQFTDAFEIGAAINPIQTDGKHSTLIKKHFNIVVAENAMKPGPIQPTEGNFNWTEVDQIVKFAKDNGQTIRFHTLVWHSQAAEWMFLDKDGNPMKPSEANKKLILDRLETHIRTIVNRYKDDIRDWDVVNEVIDPSQSDGMRRSTWFEITGTEYIELAFKVAREVAGEKAQLYINDYNTHEPKKRDFLFDLVEDMIAKGVPIDGVGHQTHINLVNPSVALMKQSIEKFASIGLDNQITEMDISIYTNDTDTYAEVPEAILIEQAHRYKAVFDMFVELKDDISSIILWGTDDGNTWLKTFPITRINLPLLFDDDLQAKHAYWALVDYSKVPAAPVKEVIEKRNSQAYKGKPKIDGEKDAIWSKTAEIATNIWVAGTDGAKANVRTMWDDGYLYIYAHVVDSKLSKASVNAYEQDSVEIFVDQNLAQTDSYEEDDGQFRVNYENEQSYNGVASADNFTTATKVLADGYVVEAAIKLNPDLIKSGAKIGYDIQVNNDQDGNGTRDTISIWNDPTGFSYQSTVNFGTLELVKGNVEGNEKKYTVVKDDNLTKIANLYGTTWQKLQELNAINNPNLIYPGQEIVLP